MRKPTFLLAFVTLAACSGDSFAPSPAQGASGSAGSGLAGGNGPAPGGGAGIAGTSAAGASGNAPSGAGGGDPIGGSAGQTGGAAGANGGAAGASGQATGGASGEGGLSGAAGKGGGGAAAGSSGAAGKGGEGGGGAPAGKCRELPKTPEAMAFTGACGAGFLTCQRPEIWGTQARLASSTCGVVIAYADPTVADTTTVAFPEASGLLPVPMVGSAAPHAVTLAGAQLFAASTGDALVGLPYVDNPAPKPYLFAAPTSATGGSDALGYRSLFVTADTLVWTGRQGYELVLMPRSGLGCTEGSSTGGCTKQFVSPSSPASPAWGVVVIGSRAYWSNKRGVSALEIASPDAIVDQYADANEVPSALAVLAGRPLLARGNKLTHLSLPLQTTTSAGAPSLTLTDGNIVDLVVHGDVVYALVDGTGAGNTNIAAAKLGSVAFKLVTVTAPAQSQPLSLTVGLDAIYFSTSLGRVFRLPVQMK